MSCNMHVLGEPAALCSAAPDTVQSPVLNGKHGHAAVVEDHKSLQEQMHHDLWREGKVLTQEPRFPPIAVVCWTEHGIWKRGLDYT